jgi:hypothetical protein
MNSAKNAISLGTAIRVSDRRMEPMPVRGHYKTEFHRGSAMSSFALYILGFIVLISGLGYGAYLLHVPHTWIIVGALVIIGVGIMSAVTRTKRRAPPSEAPPVA